MQGSVFQSPASSRAFHRRSFTPTQREKMANEQHSSSPRPWLLDAVPFMVVLLIAAHVLALISHRETASEEKGTLKTNTPKSNFIQQNGQRFWLNPNSSTVMLK
ncbi:hypothetical protein CFP56_014284 [Quercus suber]|uniref:Transmembrane protein n=1 Tax=Quercus suber TaxID=58331 RepID=A0AAW0KTX3_QUESU